MAAATQIHNADYCWSYVQSEAWVNPGGNPGVATNGMGQAQWAIGVKYGNLWGIYTGNTKHWYVNAPYPSGGLQWILIDELSRAINLGNPPPPTEPEECVTSGGEWDYEFGDCDYVSSPIIIDTRGRGYRLTRAEDGVVFDIDADGIPDTVGWTEGDDASASLLVLDRNRNGIIDDGSELFGTATPLLAGGRAPNGFAALADLDSNLDGRIDRNDLRYADLMLWTDSNHNGFSERSELRRLRPAGVTTLYLDYEFINRRDDRGNIFWLRGTVLVKNRGVARRRPMFDVLLAR